MKNAIQWVLREVRATVAMHGQLAAGAGLRASSEDVAMSAYAVADEMAKRSAPLPEELLK